MRKHHPKNEWIKRDYLAYLTEVKRMSVKSVDQAAAAIAAFEASTGYKDFKAFHIEQARKFKRQLLEQTRPETGKPLAKATINARLMALRAFFQWLAGLPGYRSKIKGHDAEYFNPSAHDSRIANAERERPAPSLEQIRHVIFAMPAETDIEQRNRALIALAILTGARDDAIASLSLKHVQLDARRIDQDARDVRTKNRKTFSTWFFPVGEDIEAIVIDWVRRLQTGLLFGPNDPLFPATRIGLGEGGGFEAAGLDRKHWTTAEPIRKVFRDAFAAAGLPYYNPHSFRKTLTQLGQRVCQKPEAFKAWSQNLGHEKVMTTLTSYGNVAGHRQAELMAEMRARAAREPEDGVPDAATIDRVLTHLRGRAA